LALDNTYLTEQLMIAIRYCRSFMRFYAASWRRTSIADTGMYPDCFLIPDKWYMLRQGLIKAR